MSTFYESSEEEQLKDYQLLGDAYAIVLQEILGISFSVVAEFSEQWIRATWPEKAAALHADQMSRIARYAVPQRVWIAPPSLLRSRILKDAMYALCDLSEDAKDLKDRLDRIPIIRTRLDQYLKTIDSSLAEVMSENAKVTNI